MAGLGLQLIEIQAILHEPDERVRLDVLGEGKRVGVAHPAAGELQRGITEAGLLEIPPYCVVLDMHANGASRGGIEEGTEIVHRVAAQSLHHGALCSASCAREQDGISYCFWAALLCDSAVLSWMRCEGYLQLRDAHMHSSDAKLPHKAALIVRAPFTIPAYTTPITPDVFTTTTAPPQTAPPHLDLFRPTVHSHVKGLALSSIFDLRTKSHFFRGQPPTATTIVVPLCQSLSWPE